MEERVVILPGAGVAGVCAADDGLDGLPELWVGVVIVIAGGGSEVAVVLVLLELLVTGLLA